MKSLMTSEKRKQSLLKEFVTSGTSVGIANIATLPLGERKRRGILILLQTLPGALDAHFEERQAAPCPVSNILEMTCAMQTS